MANYTKSFNFRNGVQVDDDNFIIDSNGLVGIGTTKPEKLLDVYGNARVSGIASLVDVGVTGIVTVGNIKLDASSGVVTATKFVGDASGLSNIVAIATDGWVTQAGTLSTTAKIGINSTIPSSNLDVDGHIKITGFSTFGNNIDANGSIDVAQNLVVTGVSTFNGVANFNTGIVPDVDEGAYIGTSGKPFSEAHIGEIRIANSTNDGEIDTATGDLTLDSATGETKVDDNLTVTGIATVTGTTLFAKQFDISGVSTFGGNIDVNGDIDVAGNAGIGSLNVSGVSTFAGLSTFTGSVNIGNALSDRLNVGASIKSNLIPDQSGASKYDLGWAAGGATFHWRNLYLTDTAVVRGLNISGVSTFSGDIQIGTAGIISAFNNDVILKAALFNVKKNASEEDLLIADADGNVKLFYDNALKFQTTGIGVSAYGELTVASLGGGTNNLSLKYGSLRYGNESAGFPYSTRKSLDILNYDTGNITFNLDATNQVNNIGNFYWTKYNSPVMTLTNDGKLGIGITLPEYRLHVSGISTFVGDVTCGNDLLVGGSLTLSAGAFTGDVTGDLTGNVTGLINSTVGMNTVALLQSTDGIGIGLTSGGDRLKVNNLNGARFYVTTEGNVGVCTHKTFTDVKFAVPDSASVLSSVGIGTTELKSTVDFSSAGGTSSNPDANITNRFMIPPLLDNTGRGNLTGLVAGALIFNTSTNKLNVYNGSAWREVTDGAV